MRPGNYHFWGMSIIRYSIGSPVFSSVEEEQAGQTKFDASSSLCRIHQNKPRSIVIFALQQAGLC